MKLGYYPGCSLHATAAEFDLSVKALFGSLNVELTEVEQWMCCGATPAHLTSTELGVALPYANLALAEEQGLSDVLTPCAACYNRLKTAAYEVAHEPHIAKRMNDIVGKPYTGKAKPIHLLEVLNANFEAVYKELVKKPLKGLKVASYYGCLLVRPPKIVNFDDAEDPQTMDKFVALAGAESVEWSHKTECCGASHALPRTDVVLRLCSDIVSAAREKGAEAIAVACPLCHANLDMRQSQMNMPKEAQIPVLYISQILALAAGAPHDKLGFNKHIIDPMPLLKAKGFIQ